VIRGSAKAPQPATNMAWGPLREESRPCKPVASNPGTPWAQIASPNPPYNDLDLQFSACLRQASPEASQQRHPRSGDARRRDRHFSFGGEVQRGSGPARTSTGAASFVCEVNRPYAQSRALRVCRPSPRSQRPSHSAADSSSLLPATSLSPAEKRSLPLSRRVKHGNCCR